MNETSGSVNSQVVPVGPNLFPIVDTLIDLQSWYLAFV